jgi:hypothetical protein
MNYTMWPSAMEPAEGPMQIEALSVYRACEQVHDGRHKRGVRYPVALILTLLVLGKLVGMRTPAAIAQWMRLRDGWLREQLPGMPARLPCASTYSNVLRSLDSEQVNEVLAQFLVRIAGSSRCGEEPSRLLGQVVPRERYEQVALDGKTLRGTLGHEAADQQPMHQLGLYETGTGVLLTERIVGEKQNERSLLGEFLTPRWLTGRLISADAMFTYDSFCLQVIQAGGDYVLIAKGNQPGLQEDLRLFFTEPPADCQDWRGAVSWHKGHGRLERRELVASTELNDFLAKPWPGVAQVFRLTRTIWHHGHTRHEVVYGLTSRSPAQSSAAQLLEAVRRHWTIENRLHWRRDVTLGEDHCQVRKGAAPRLLAVLNSFVLGLLDFLQVRCLPPFMRLLDAQPFLALRLLLQSALTFT